MKLQIAVDIADTNRILQIAGQIHDVIVKVETFTPKEDCDKKSCQPGGNTFEQSVLLIGDAVLMDLIGTDNIKEKNRELMKRHANLE